MKCKKLEGVIVIMVEEVAEMETATLELINAMRTTVSDETVKGYKICLEDSVVDALFPGETNCKKINSFIQKHILTALETKPAELDMPFRFFKIPVADSNDSE